MKHRKSRRVLLERARQSVGAAMVTILFAACSHGHMAAVTQKPPTPRASDPTDVSDPRLLAGTWEYEEGGLVVTLTLDEEGNGDYAYKGGRFETGALWDHTWTGRWAQLENDREGGFEVKLSPDYSEGDGRWWYTRIENDTTPSKSGGRFKVNRVVPGTEVADGQTSFVR